MSDTFASVMNTPDTHMLNGHYAGMGHTAYVVVDDYSTLEEDGFIYRPMHPLLRGLIAAAIVTILGVAVAWLLGGF
jgi:hypothetical protein